MSNPRRAERAANSELHLGRERFLQLSQQMMEAYEKLDGTLAHTLRMTAEMVDTAHQIGLEPEKGQKLFRNLTSCSNSMMNTRDELIAAHLESTRIRLQTDQAETDAGCFPNPFRHMGQLQAVA